MFGRKKKEDKKVKAIINDLEYLVEDTCEEIERIIDLNKLKLKFVKVKITVNSVKLFYELYVTSNDEICFTKIKQIHALNHDFELINSDMVITSEERMVVFKIPRPNRKIVKHSELFEMVGIEELKNEYQLPMIIGVDENNQIRVEDLAEKPHCFIAGTTGSGKSVAFNGLICTWLKLFNPDEISFAFIDPKGGIELGFYENLDNYLFDSIKVMGDESIALIYKIFE